MSSPACEASSQRAKPMSAMSQPGAPDVRCALMPAQPPLSSSRTVKPSFSASANRPFSTDSEVLPPHPA